MDNIATALGNQILEEQQTYLDNSRLKHGVPMRTGVALSGGGEREATPARPGPQQFPADTMSASASPAPERTARGRIANLVKTAAIVGVSAVAGAFGIPPLITTLAGKATQNAVEKPGPAAPETGMPVDWNDLVGFLKNKGYDRVGHE